MAVDMFLSISNIDGESKDGGHTNEMDILSWEFGIVNPGSFENGGGGGSGRAEFNDLSISKYVDKATTKLMLNCANGTHLNEATLTVRKAGGTALEYIIFKMEKVKITNVVTGGSGDGDRLTENFTLAFENFEVKYTAQEDDGMAGAISEVKWDIGTNAAK